MDRDREAEKAASRRIFFGVGETAHWNLWVLNQDNLFCSSFTFHKQPSIKDGWNE
jgi:hypothetical protein